jgi:hypothetical protein
MYKNILITLAALCLFASPALAFDATPFVTGPSAGQVLFQSTITEFDGAGECVNFETATTAATCETLGTVQLQVAKDAYVTALSATLVFAGTAGFECDFQIEVGATGVAKGTLLDQATATVVGTTNTQKQGILLNAGDFIGVVNTDGTGQACAGAADPKYVVTVWGYYVD